MVHSLDVENDELGLKAVADPGNREGGSTPMHNEQESWLWKLLTV